ncbi:hypothetical protein TCAL_16993 [Tigriopus californicus]|uniref:Secreted protein n=1 Tax=Tigriopus californicus TaxID=6832 RepID=A0A553PGM7_TIGCA|nr:hypothetical protein TCAL_16993 [Tigriopus californicus]
MAIHASLRLLCLANSVLVTLRIFPPVPVKSRPDLVKRIQSMSEKPGFRATLFLGLPSKSNCYVRKGTRCWHSKSYVSLSLKAVRNPQETTCWEFPKGNNPPGVGTPNEEPAIVGTPRPPVPDGDTDLLTSHLGGHGLDAAVGQGHVVLAAG